MLTEQEVIDRLREAVKAAGGLKAFAARHRFTSGYISDVLHGKRGLADRILRSIGIDRKTIYQEKEDSL